MKVFRALLLVLALSMSANAGWMEADKTGEIPCDRIGIMPNGRDGNIPYDRDGNMDNGKDGWMECGKTGEMPNDLITATALQLLHSIMPLF